MESTNKLPGVFALIKQSLIFYKKNFKKLVSIGAIIIGIYAIEFILLGVFFPGEPNVETLSKGGIILYFLIMFILGIVNTVAQMIIQIAFVKISYEADSGSLTSIKDLLKRSSKFFWPFLWVNILMGLVVIGSAVFLVIPAMILGIYLSFAAYALILDNKRGLNSLTTSFHYIKGNWWRVLWRFLGPSLIILVIGLIILAITVLFLSSSGVLSFESLKAFSDSMDALSVSIENMTVVPAIVSIILYFIGYCFFMPISFFYSYAIYKHLKAQKAAPDHSTELKKARGWFMGLSIFGLVVPVLLILTTLTGTVLVSLNRARTLGEQQMNRPLGDNSILPATVAFPEKSEPPIKSDLSTLEAQTFVSEDYFFSMRIPKGWATEDNKEGIAVGDPTNKIDARITVSPRDFSETFPPGTPEIKQINEVGAMLLDKLPLNNPVFRKLTIGTIPAYLVEGTTVSGGIAVKVHYYLIPDGQYVYLIIAAFVNNPNDLKVEQMIIDSISTFKIVE